MANDSGEVRKFAPRFAGQPFRRPGAPGFRKREPLKIWEEYAHALLQANDLGGAIEAYQKYIATYGANKTMLGLVYQRLGYAYLLHGDRDQAVTAFLAVLDVPGALNKDHALFELGKMEEAQSRPEGALAHYQELMKSYPNSPLASEATVRIKALEAKKGPADAGSGGPEGPAPPSAKPMKP